MLELIGLVAIIGMMVWRLKWGTKLKEAILGDGMDYNSNIVCSTAAYPGYGPGFPTFMTTIKPTREVPLAENEAYLYDVYLIYAENLTKPIVKKGSAIARTDEDAKIKSGLMKEIDPQWDSDYLSILVKQIGVVRFKKKPTEVKIVKEVEQIEAA